MIVGYGVLKRPVFERFAKLGAGKREVMDGFVPQNVLGADGHLGAFTAGYRRGEFVKRRPFSGIVGVAKGGGAC